MVRDSSPRIRTARSAASLLAILAAVALLLAACGKGDAESEASPSSVPSPGASPLSGPKETVELYRNNCISCHGTEMQGMMGPDTNLQQVGARLTQDQIRQQIAGGGSLMPAFKSKLSEEEIDSLAEWLAGKK